MDRVEAAGQLVLECESRIRSLMEEALAARQYEQIGRLASLASALSALVEGEARSVTTNSEPAVVEARINPTASAPVHRDLLPSSDPPRPGRKHPSDEYPRFERHGDRLIKLGWSKKERSVYEHRTSLETVKAVTAKLFASVGKGSYLRMDEVLPVELPDGAEVPSYQAYLVLAWLRDRGTVQRQGNDGYKLARKHLRADEVEELWAQTPERE